MHKKRSLSRILIGPKRTVFPDPIFKILFILVMGSNISVAGALQAQVSLEPASRTIAIGEEFSINITINPVNNPVTGAQFSLIFDSNLVSVKNVVQGDLFRKNGIATYFNPGISDNSKGILANVWEVITTPEMNVIANGTFVKVNMYAKNTGTIDLALTNVILCDPGGKPIPFILENSTITISAMSPQFNLISNPGFESGTSPWLFYTSGTGTFSRASPGSEGNNSAKIAIGSSGTNIQLYQAGIAMEPNTHYRLSFSAYSISGQDLTVRLFKHGSPYTSYSPYFTVDLGTGWRIFSTEFTSSGFADTVNDGRLQFWLAEYAAPGDTYYIDDIRLEKVNSSPVPTAVPTSNQATQTIVIQSPIPPGITTQPVNQTVNEGQKATFSVAASGTAPLAYQWQKNGMNISGATSASYTNQITTLIDSGSKYSVQVTNSAGTIISNAATITVIPLASINLIVNPGFESGTASWLFYTSGTGTFSTVSPGYEGNNNGQLALISGGTNIQLYNIGITLEPNTRYRLSFAAYSMTGQDVTVRLLKHGSPYTSYAPDFTVDLGTSWRVFTTEFTSSGFEGTVNDGRLQFWLAPFATAGDAYYIDDVRLEKVQV